MSAIIEQAPRINKSLVVEPKPAELSEKDLDKLMEVCLPPETLGPLTNLSHLNREDKDHVMELRQKVRESMMDGVGDEENLRKPTNTSRSIMKGGSQNRPPPRLKPSIFLPKNTVGIKDKEECDTYNPYEIGMVIVERTHGDETTGRSKRVIHEGGKYRAERSIKVKMMEDTRQLLEVA